MDSYSGENFNIKTRKPYTITKQRERWTEEEHNSFLEALKLYGRAWQRIEEHIGTKTAVQIRSHAQKFFTKLEKEAVAKGVPVKQALDIEIPPPRPKRKPNYPYPRKTGPKTNNSHMAENEVKQATLVSSLQLLDLERKTLTEKTSHEKKLENTKTSEEGQNCNEDPQETPCASLSSDNENSVPRSNPGVFQKFIPNMEEVINHDESHESYITIETRKHQEMDQDGNKHTNITSNISLFESSHLAHENIIQGQYSDKPADLINGAQGVQTYPRHVPVQVVDGNQGVSAKTSVTTEMSLHQPKVNNPGEIHQHSNPNLFVDIAGTTSASGHHINSPISSTVPTFHPLFTPFSDSQEDSYRSFLNFSSTISSLMVSSLLQNPAAHAAASFAAKFWHPANTTGSSGDHLDPETPPSMAAIVAATVAAATAWWSAHGLLPVIPPFYPGGFTCTFGTPIDGNQIRVANYGTDKAPSEIPLQEEMMDAEKTEDLPPPEPVIPPFYPGGFTCTFGTSIDGNQTRVANNGTDKAPSEIPLQEEMMDAEKTEDLPPPEPAADLSSSEDSEEKLNTEASPVDTKEMGPVVELHDLSKTNVRKPVDRSSCGSNTTSSSENEMDALENHGKETEETRGSDVNDSNSRSSGRSTISPNESWKEVSEEGRLAFQALFSREVLPQSFTDTHKLAENVVKNNELDLNRVSEEPGESTGFAFLRSGLGSVKPNVSHVGFKPYKRCSIEAKEICKIVSSGSACSQNDEKGPKRIRLETKASS